MEFRKWSCGPDTLTQWRDAVRLEDGSWDIDPDSHYGDKPAYIAEEIIERAVNDGAEPIYDDDGRVQGYHYPDGRDSSLFTDCDECTYEEYYGSPYEETNRVR